MKNKDFSIEGVSDFNHKVEAFLTYLKANKEDGACYDFTSLSYKTFKDLLEKYKYEMKTTIELEYLKTYSDIQNNEIVKEYKTLKETIAKEQFINMCKDTDKDLLEN